MKREREPENKIPEIKSRIRGSRVEVRSDRTDICRVCKGKIYRGDVIYYFPRTKKVEHYNCTRTKNAP